MSIIVWFTGLSGSGKTTISSTVSEALGSRQIASVILDADVMRTQICRDLGFSPADRRESLRRISREAGRVSSSVPVVLVSAISPYDELRREIRSEHQSFLEVFVNAPLAVCEARDPKGLYQRARAGLIAEFTGISAPYEVPRAPDVECRTDQETVEVSSQRVVEAIVRQVKSNGREHRRVVQAGLAQRA